MNREILEQKKNLIDKAKQLIQNNFKIDTGTLHKEIGMSEFEFLRYFKIYNGETPRQFAKRCEVEYSKQFLKNTNVQTVATILNYSHTQNFIRTFKRYEGITPKQWQMERIKY